MVQNDLQRLCRKLDYTFQDIKLLKRALTHRSMGLDNNERYEFLGDSILSFCMTFLLFQRFPELSEGKLSRMRASLVKGETLADIAAQIQLGDYLYLGQGELKTGGFRRASTIADALEAVIAAVYLDGGINAAQTLIVKLFDTRLQATDLIDNLKDAKTQLQEHLQSAKRPLPEYALIKVEGDEHDQIFYVTCSVKGIKQATSGKGPNRRKAEQQAAKLMLDALIPGGS